MWSLQEALEPQRLWLGISQALPSPAASFQNHFALCNCSLQLEVFSLKTLLTLLFWPIQLLRTVICYQDLPVSDTEPKIHLMQAEAKCNNLKMHKRAYCRGALAACCLHSALLLCCLAANTCLPIPVTTLYKPIVINRNPKLHAHTQRTPQLQHTAKFSFSSEAI